MKVAVTSKSFSKNEILIEEFKRNFDEIKLNHSSKKLTDEELIDFLKDCEGAIIALEEFNKNVIDNLPNIKAISKFGVGLNNIDIEYAKSKNIKIGWEKGVNKQSVAEMTLGFMLMLIRNLYVTSNLLSNGTWEKNGGYSLYNKTIGIIGVGNIGQELINLLKAFNCTILVNDIINQDEYYEKHNLKEVSKEEIFRHSDIITIHTPLNEQTNNLININTLQLMKRSAFLINTARGEIVNLNDLKFALKTNLIAGAAIDVYHEEPPKDLELLGLPNLICTPHIGGNSEEAVLAMGRSAIKQLKDLLND
jgi:D-3-phosphoglycerate dehydrogenase